MGKTNGWVAGAPSVASEVSGLESVTVVLDSAVDLTVMEGGSGVVETVNVSDVTVVVSRKADSVGLTLLAVVRTEVGGVGRATVVCGIWDGEEVAGEAVWDGVEADDATLVGRGVGGVGGAVVTSLGGVADVTAAEEAALTVDMSVCAEGAPVVAGGRAGGGDEVDGGLGAAGAVDLTVEGDAARVEESLVVAAEATGLVVRVAVVGGGAVMVLLGRVT